MKKNVDSKKQLLEVLTLLAPGELKKNPLLSSALVAADNGEPSLDDMPSDEEMERELGAGNEGSEGEDTGELRDLSQDVDDSDIGDPDDIASEEPVDGNPEPEPEEEPAPEETKVGPYDLTFHLRKIISAFDQVTREAEQLRKLTEGITANMSSEQQASWIEQRRFFIETAKEAEAKWSEFKKVLLNFSLTPKL